MRVVGDMVFFEFEVIEEDISKGIPRMPSSCALALCIKRALPDIEYVFVTPLSVEMFDRTNSFRTVGGLPHQVDDFIINFDFKEPVKPMKFELGFRKR